MSNFVSRISRLSATAQAASDRCINYEYPDKGRAFGVSAVCP